VVESIVTNDCKYDETFKHIVRGMVSKIMKQMYDMISDADEDKRVLYLLVCGSDKSNTRHKAHH